VILLQLKILLYVQKKQIRIVDRKEGVMAINV